MTRVTSTRRELQAGCYACHGTAAHWTGPNAQALAARHHDTTDHPTWCNIQLAIVYGAHRADPRQIDIESAIAASSGERPVSPPLPDPDAPACSSADVSAPEGRSSRRSARGRKPETAAL